MKLPIPVVETVKKRHSVRTYEKRPLSPQDRGALLDCMNWLDNPFGVQVKKYITDRQLNVDGEKLGTYGVINGASTFLGISIPDTELAPLAAGYEFENLILYATNMGLGTVWLAATFNRDSFSSAMNIPKDELFPAISPVGYPASKPSLTETLMRSTMKSSKRKEWESLFYQENFITPLTKGMAGAYADPLEMVRLAPSAKNLQPWRIRKAGDVYHFYVVYNPGISKGEEVIKRVDLGIALSHFHQTVMEQGLTGRFEVMPQEDVQLPENTYYVISWFAESST
ncbi:MAG TPA: nitroreductase [Candidatus Blautia stercoravium]|nr:nitroreductase [Candidatus Blautia stercoravium]